MNLTLALLLAISGRCVLHAAAPPLKPKPLNEATPDELEGVKIGTELKEHTKCVGNLAL
jgi:hypothetical protein